MTDTDQTARRSYFKFADSRPWSDMDRRGDLEVTSGEQGVTISITEEHAVDSYNQVFTCAAVLPRVVAEDFRNWLNEVLS